MGADSLSIPQTPSNTVVCKTMMRPYPPSAELPSGLYDPAALYLRGVAEALFAEIAWRADLGEPKQLEALFVTTDHLDRRAARTTGNGLRLLAARRDPGRKVRHAITSVRIDDVAIRTFDATAVAIVRTLRRSEDTTLLADWSLTAEKVGKGWMISRFQIEPVTTS